MGLVTDQQAAAKTDKVPGWGSAQNADQSSVVVPIRPDKPNPNDRRDREIGHIDQQVPEQHCRQQTLGILKQLRGDPATDARARQALAIALIQGE